MNTKKTILFIIIILAAGFFVYNKKAGASLSANPNTETSATVSVKFINSTISADGIVTAQNQAKLNFQTSGKLVYLPFKEGDTVNAGQTIARLDSYTLQRQLTQALNLYRSARDTFDQAQQNQNNGVLKNEQQTTLRTAGAGVGTYGIDNGSTDYINDLVKRLADQS